MAARRLGLAVLAGVSVVWGAAWTVAGLWLLLSVPREWPMFAQPAVSAGVAALAAGQFVFVGLVADRAFPEIGRRLGWVEAALALAFVAGLGATVFGTIRGMNP